MAWRSKARKRRRGRGAGGVAGRGVAVGEFAGVARRGALAVLSPYARLGLGEAGERTLRFGAKYLLESAFSFEFELERREDELLAPAQRFMLRGEYRW